MINVLFVCHQARLRSRTAAHCLGQFCTRYAGIDDDAERVLTDDDIQWADVIVCMEPSHEQAVLARHSSANTQVWNIPDKFNYMQDELVWTLRRKAERHLESRQ